MSLELIGNLDGSLGLCGAHRTGKTTMAIAIGDRLNIPFVRTTTSQVFAQLGLDPAEPMDFKTRLFVQNHVLDAAEQVWQNSGIPFISDRTPIDMIAYTLGDIQGKTEVDFDLLSEYIDRCFVSTNHFFQNLAIIQPGIPLVYEQGKAAPSVDKLDELLRAVSPGQRFAIRIIDAQPSAGREAGVPYVEKPRRRPTAAKR